MKLAVVVDCVPLILRIGAILAFLVACVRLGTLFPLSCDIPIESLVLTVLNLAFVLVEAVGALLVGSVVAASFGGHDRACFSDAVRTFR